MRQITISLYGINELSEKAKNRAYEQWLNQGDNYSWSKENSDTLEKFEKIFPIKVKDYEYGYNNFIHFSMECDEEISELSGVRLISYLVNNYYNDITSKKYYSINGLGADNYKSRHSNFQREIENCPLTGYCIDNDILQPIWDFITYKSFDSGTTFEELMRYCLNRWVNACKDDFEACSTMEYFVDMSEANEWEYESDGTMNNG